MKTTLKTQASVLLAALFGVVFSTGCVTRVTDFTLLSTKNIDLAKASTLKRAPNRVHGEDPAYIIIFIPTGVPHVKEAVDKALEQVPGAVGLVDGVVKKRNWWFIFGESSIIVEGTPLIDPSLAAKAIPSRHIVSYYNQDRREFSVKYLEEAKFVSLQRSLHNGLTKEVEQMLADAP